MEKIILITDIPNGRRNLALRELVEDFLPKNNFKRGEDEVPYLCGYLEIDIDKKIFTSFQENPNSGPVFYIANNNGFGDSKTTEQVKKYILGNKKERENILNKLNEKISIDYSDSLNNHDSFSFGLIAYANSFNPKVDKNILKLKGNEFIVTAFDKERNEYIGILMIDRSNDELICAYIHEEYRNQGIFSQMWKVTKNLTNSISIVIPFKYRNLICNIEDKMNKPYFSNIT